MKLIAKDNVGAKVRFSYEVKIADNFAEAPQLSVYPHDMDFIPVVRPAYSKALSASG